MIDGTTVMCLIEQDANQLASYSDLLAGDTRYYSLHNIGFIDVIQPGYCRILYASYIRSEQDSYGRKKIPSHKSSKVRNRCKSRGKYHRFEVHSTKWDWLNKSSNNGKEYEGLWKQNICKKILIYKSKVASGDCSGRMSITILVIGYSTEQS